MLTGPPPKFHGTRDNLVTIWTHESSNMRWAVANPDGRR